MTGLVTVSTLIILLVVIIVVMCVKNKKEKDVADVKIKDQFDDVSNSPKLTKKNLGITASAPETPMKDDPELSGRNHLEDSKLI